jgi:L-asparagine transporter-like permease
VAAPRRDTYTGRVRPWIKYTLIRIVLFAGVLAILMLFTPAPPWLATVIAAIVGLCISYIFFRPQRDELAESIASRRTRGETNADEDEDDALNRSA